MKNRKKIMALFLSLAMLLGYIGVMPATVAHAADLATTNIKVNYQDETIEVTGTKNDEIYATAKYDATDSKTQAKAVWDTYVIGDKAAYIDYTSYIKASTDGIVYIKGGTKVIPVQIKKQEATLKAAFSAVNKVTPKGVEELTLTNTNAIGSDELGYIYFLYKADGKAYSQYSSITNLEWRKGTTGAWRDVKADGTSPDLSLYNVRGASLYFRIKASDTSAIATSEDATAKAYIAVGNRAGKETKVSYAKRATAPKVSVDGSTYALSLKAGQEYKIDGTGNEWIDVKTAYTNAEKKFVKPTLYTLYTKADKSAKYTYDSTKDFTILVRTAATTKKIASKTNKFVVAGVTAPTAAATDGLTVSFATANRPASGYKFTNTSNKVLQVAVVDKTVVYTSDALDQAKLLDPANGVKWVTVKAKGTKDGVATISAKSYSKITPANQVIVYRFATVKANPKAETPVAFALASKAVVMTAPTVAKAGTDLAVTLAPGTATGSTKATVTVGTGNKLAYKVATEQTAIDMYTKVEGLTTYTSGKDITGLKENDKVIFYETTKYGEVVKYSAVQTIVTSNLKAAE